MPATCLKLPTASFRDMAEFRDWRRRNAALLAARAQRDAAHATTKPELTLAGTCGVCLRPANFRSSTAHSEPTATGRVPQWRQQLHCDCDSALPAHHRAILQFVRGTTGLQPWFKIRVHGDAKHLAATLAALAWVDPNHAHPHLIVAPDTLPDLHEAANSLVPGGHFVFTCHFDPDLPTSWDTLQHLRTAGFQTATTHLYWSEEFAYLGAANFVCVGGK